MQDSKDLIKSIGLQIDLLKKEIDVLYEKIRNLEYSTFKILNQGNFIVHSPISVLNNGNLIVGEQPESLQNCECENKNDDSITFPDSLAINIVKK